MVARIPVAWPKLERGVWDGLLSRFRRLKAREKKPLRHLRSSLTQLRPPQAGARGVPDPEEEKKQYIRELEAAYEGAAFVARKGGKRKRGASVQDVLNYAVWFKDHLLEHPLTRRFVGTGPAGAVGHRESKQFALAQDPVAAWPILDDSNYIRAGEWLVRFASPHSPPAVVLAS